MKKLLSIFVLLFVMAGAQAQNANSYRTKASGVWSNPSTWQRYDGTTWLDATTFPTSSVDAIIVDSAVIVDTSLTVDQLIINSRGSITIDTARTVTIANAADSVDMVVYGSVYNYGTLTPTGRIALEDGATYYHRRPGGGGSVPTATWRDGSTCQIDSTAPSTPTNITNQSFYHFVWNSPNQSGNVGLNFPDGYVFRGDLIIHNTNGKAWRITNLSAGQTKTIHIRGNVVVGGATAMLTATGSTSDTAARANIYVEKNILVSAGEWNLVAASNPYAEWFVNGDVIITGGKLSRGGMGAWRGTVTFRNNRRQAFEVTSPGTIANPVTFRLAQSAGGEVELRFPWTLNGTLQLDSGKLITTATNLLTIGQGSQIKAINGYIDGPLSYTLASTVQTNLNYPLGKNGVVRPFQMTVTQNSASATNYTAELFNAAPSQRLLPQTLRAIHDKWYVNVLTTNASAVSDFSVTMTYTSEDSCGDKDSIRIARSTDGGAWENCGGSGTTAENGTITSNVLLSLASSTDFVLAYAAAGAVVSLPAVTTAPIDTDYISTTSAFSGGVVLNDGGGAVVARGVCWNTTGAPTVDDAKTIDGNGTGSFISTLTNLTPGVRYYVRAYATNSAGTAYGNEISFTTMAQLTVPVVTTNAVTNIVNTTATSGGRVVSWGGTAVTERGVCWSTHQNPTVDDEKTISGAGLGSFTCSVGGLALGTTYYLRAYAINSTGVGYGEEVTFRTPDPQPDVTKIVAKDGSGDYTTLQAAFRDVPTNYTGKWHIFVKKGRYEEVDTLATNKNNVILVGEDRDSTIIVYDIYAADGKRNPVVQLNGNDITVMNLTIQNTSHDIAQGLALETNGDRIAFYNCKVLGYQDTYLGNGTGRIYFKHCFIEGTVDFIYGGANMVFDSCTINIIRNGGYITAGSTLPAAKYGITFLDCQITHPEIGYNGTAITSFYLGRPWQNAPRVVYIRCYEPAAVAPAGWTAMGAVPALFGEYQCYGDGFRPESRTTQWGNAVRVLSDSEAVYYTIPNIFSKYSTSPAFAANWVPQKPDVQFPVTSVSRSKSEVPAKFDVKPNYPNPFNPSTTLEYAVPAPSMVTIKVYDLLGREIKTLLHQFQREGYYSVTLTAEGLSSGVYFYSVQCGTLVKTGKMILNK